MSYCPDRRAIRGEHNYEVDNNATNGAMMICTNCKRHIVNLFRQEEATNGKKEIKENEKA